MSFDSQDFGGGNLFSIHGQISSEGLFHPPSNDVVKLQKDPALVHEFVFPKDSQSGEELVTVPAEVSGMADDLDLGYDTNSEGSSPMSAKSPWGGASTPSSTFTSEDDFLADFEEETRSSLVSILDDSCSEMWNNPQSENPQEETNSRTSMMGASPHLSPGSPVVPQISTTTSTIDFTAALQRVLLNRGQEGDETNAPIQTSKPIRKRAACSSTCGLTPRKRPKKFPSLIQNLPDKQNGAELYITVQPEKHHRARYRTEGSRGSVKDDSGESYPTLKLDGVNQAVTLQVFVGIDQGKIRPHGYYQACKVTGRNTTPCEEKDIDGTIVLEVPWEPTNGKLELSVDCIGILKLRNADVEQRIGPIRSKRKSTSVRLIFRAVIPTADGSFFILQTVSRSITCTQPLGHPEIVKKSLTKCSMAGGEELFIIGKNFTSKATTEVKLRQMDSAGKVTWEADCEIDKSLFQNTHIVCKIPPYPNQHMKKPMKVFVVVTSGPNKCSDTDAHFIEYIPEPDSGLAHATSSNFLNTLQDGEHKPYPGTVLSQSISPLSPPISPPLSPPSTTTTTLLKPEPQLEIAQQSVCNQAEVNPDFAVALQVLASTYVKDRQVYDVLLSQSQIQTPNLLDGPLSVMDVLHNN